MLRTTVSRPVCLGIKQSSRVYDQIFILLMRGALSDERMSLSFTVAAGPRQGSHSRVRNFVLHREQEGNGWEDLSSQWLAVRQNETARLSHVHRVNQ
jgi:hypothetical protein